MRSVTLTVGWVVCVVLVAATLARWTGLDVRSTVLVAASTGAPVLLLPAWPVALVACGLQQRWLALVAVVLIVVDLVAIAPLVAGGRRASEGLQVRVLALNVQYDHPTGPAVTRQVLAEHPDIVVLSELAPVSLKGLDLSSYPYTSQVPAGPVSTGGIWSRWPIVTGGTRVVLEQPLAQATIRLPDGQLLHVLQVHVHSPTSNDRIPTWRAELRSMRGVLAGAHGLTIVAGDFNSSRTDPDFAALLGGSPGFADAADGQGLLPTWPSGKPLVPPVLRLDHVLISRGIGVHGVRVLGPTGSDHRAVLADLRIAPA